ncbi:MAG: substrate-binding domain-containing protein [Deltaproteobacteria bacterium]|nr:substrate-binding domain-containing protein [Deltaproteobacteria bacterium]MDQ3298177.1 substrate-binding domain-containing protein [Myxococcota bacterium]
MTISLALSVLIGLVLARGRGDASTGRAGPDKGGELLIGLSLDTLKEARWQADRDLFVAKVKELGATALVQSANSDDTRQMQDIEALISRGVRAIVIVPHDSKTMARAVEIAHKAGIPVIAYDRMIRESNIDLYVSFNNLRVGQQQAEWLVKRLPDGKGRIIRINGAPTDDNAKVLKAGQDEILKPYLDRGDIKIIHEDWAEEWKPENGKKIVNAAITAHGRDFEAVLAANDGTAGGAIQALTEEGIAGKVLVTGQDAELAAMQRIAAGTQTMTIYKPLKELSGKAAEAAVRLARGQPVIARTSQHNGTIEVPAILLDTVAVDKSNLEATVIKDGFHSKEAIYRGLTAP